MNFSKIVISEQERVLVSEFMGEQYPLEIDFNWLMPVVEKIEGLKHLITIYGLYVKIDNSPIVKGGLQADSKIEATWLAVVAFIKFHQTSKT